MKHPIHKLLLAIAATALPFSLCPAEVAKPAPQGFECQKIDKPFVHIPIKNGAPIKLKDVATIIDSAENTHLAAWANDKAALIVNIQRQPGANVIAVVDSIKKLLPQLTASLPQSIEVTALTDRTVTIRASVADVQFELMLSVALVVLVIFVFLQSARATIIPAIAVPLSLVGTFGVMYLANFSINNLSLMALTIATGFVVDDAIVMIENVSRYIEEGMPPLEAALKGSQQIGFTIISLPVSLIAVLLPLLFMGDVVGRDFPDLDADDVRPAAAPEGRPPPHALCGGGHADHR